MAKFRHHRSNRVVETAVDEKIAEHDEDPLWQRLDDDDDTAAVSLDEDAPASRTRKS